MFKFDFDLDDEELGNHDQGSNVAHRSETAQKSSSKLAKQLIQEPFAEISLLQLVRLLLPSIIVPDASQ